MASCTTTECLEYIGALEDDSDVLHFHGKLLIYQIEALDGLAAYHTQFPWKWVQMLDPSSWVSVLSEAKDVWRFVVDVVDLLRHTDELFHELAICRFQAFRDCMTRAEYLG